MTLTALLTSELPHEFFSPHVPARVGRNFTGMSQPDVHVFNPALGDRLTWDSTQMEIHIFKNGTPIVIGLAGTHAPELTCRIKDDRPLQICL